MQKELKFRAWDKTKKQMVSWEKLCDEDKNYAGDDDSEHLADYFNNVFSNIEPLMQFTGLLDKNGVEIYEGSIIKDNKDGAIGLVIYTPPCFSVKLKEKLNEEEYWLLGAGKAYPDNYKLVDTEVIGNIYEHPKLLEEAK